MSDTAADAAPEPLIPALARHWPILTAAMLGWALDAFDFTMLLFLIPHLRTVFGVGLPAMAFVVTATGLAKIVGTIGWGAVADRVGRKLPFMFSILWFSAFCGLSGLAWSYASLLVLRILFGLGYGGEWSTSASLLMETVPPRLRGVAAGIMMLGFEVGFLVSALVFRTLFPLFGWRWMFALGVIPALLVIPVRRLVPESPQWLATRGRPAGRARLRVTAAALQGWFFLAALNIMGWAIFALYPTFLITVRHLSPAGVFPYVAIYSLASIVGKPLAGRLAQRLGERRFIVLYLVLTIPSALLYVLVASPVATLLGAVLMGLLPNSIFAIVPMYLARRFPAAQRATGVGIGWAMSGISVLAPYAIALLTPGFGLGMSMTIFILVFAILSAVISLLPTEHTMPPAES